MPPDGTFFLLLAQKKEGKEKGAPVASPGLAGSLLSSSDSGNVKNSAGFSCLKQFAVLFPLTFAFAQRVKMGFKDQGATPGKLLADSMEQRR